MNKTSKNPELLAPAGNIVSAITAFSAGADAVYAGLSHFNARARTENFTVEELAKTITYAHSNGKKVYVTLNTIIKEQEIANFAKVVATVASLEADAVIIQDFGALRIVRDYFPMLAIHASTQMGIHNLPGCRLAKELGIKRVILERQISFEELSCIAESSPVELEIFIHGALCCSISGSCLLSSWISGESGNRGECKQNCRRKFLDSSGKQAYFLSTKDLCLLEDISKIKKIGITALKIEGRLKKNDYVQNTVRAYRIVLDADEKNLNEAIKEAKDVLALVYGRKTVRLFSGQKPFSEILNPTESGTTGVLCGKVLKSSNSGFYLLCKRKIHLGDRLRLQTPDQRSTCILTVNRILINNKDRVECLPGSECFIPSTRMPKPGVNAFKIGESITDYAKKIANLPTSIPRPISVKIKINNNGLFAEARNPFATLNWSRKAEFFPARQHPITKEKIVEEFSKSN
ncbi:MAG: peptidase U32 family protein, partial [Candidatus Nanoarchaeia archaeon]